MFGAVVLICSLSIAKPDCQMNTALHFEVVRGAWELPLGCMTAGMMHAAEMKRQAGEGEYPKISCTRSGSNANHG